MVPFEQLFNKGDIICSNEFRSGICMIVENIDKFNNVYNYTCSDLLEVNQLWSAYEKDNIFKIEYGWRLATDKDIVKHLATKVNTNLGKVAGYKVLSNDDGIVLDGGAYRDSIYLAENETEILYSLLSKVVK